MHGVRCAQADRQLIPVGIAGLPKFTHPGRSQSVKFHEAILRLEHDHAFQFRKFDFHPLPDPDRDIFRRRIFETFDVVQILMVEPLEERLECGLDCEEIGDKARHRIDRPFEPQFHAIRMAVQAAAAMAFAGVGQFVRRLETKCLRDFQRPAFNLIGGQ